MASFTEKAIEASFLKLLNERPLDKITVKDIVTDCGINRNSFYYHYADLPALIESIYTDKLNQLLREEALYDSMEDCLRAGIQAALENKKAILHLYQSASRAAYESYLYRLADHVVRQYIMTVTEGKLIHTEDLELIIAHFKYQLTGFILDWLRQGLNCDIEHTLHRLCELFEGTLQTAITRAEK